MQSNDIMGYETSKALKYSLMATSGLSAALGVGFIIWGVIVQNPPETALTMYVILRCHLSERQGTECCVLFISIVVEW
jgi:hypothetical protein